MLVNDEWCLSNSISSSVLFHFIGVDEKEDSFYFASKTAIETIVTNSTEKSAVN